MAEIYSKVRGVKLEKLIAKLDGVQDGMDRETNRLARSATRLLNSAPSERTGASFIETEKAGLDRFVILNDTRSHLGAMTIEKGRKPNKEGKGGHPGLHILGRAVLGQSGRRR